MDRRSYKPVFTSTEFFIVLFAQLQPPESAPRETEGRFVPVRSGKSQFALLVASKTKTWRSIFAVKRQQYCLPKQGIVLSVVPVTWCWLVSASLAPKNCVEPAVDSYSEEELVATCGKVYCSGLPFCFPSTPTSLFEHGKSGTSVAFPSSSVRPRPLPLPSTPIGTLTRFTSTLTDRNPSCTTRRGSGEWRSAPHRALRL